MGLKLLLVLPQPPAVEGGAADRCSVGLLRGLRDHGVDVRVVAAHQHFTPHFDRADDTSVRVVEVTHPSGVSARIANLRRPHSELARSSFAAVVAEAAREVDAVHLEQIETAALGRRLSAPTAVHLHYRAHLDRDYGPPWGRPFRQLLEFVRAERAATRHHRWLVANSPRVAETLHRLAPTADVVVAPLTLDPADYAVGPAVEAPTAGLLGTAAWPPTARAFDALVHDVWPRVAQAVPEAGLVLAGRGSDRVVLRDRGRSTSITVLGEVGSAIDTIRSWSVLVYPVARGSGMKVKVLEALALGVPVVTTVDGAEGVPANDGLVVAADAEGVATATAAILRDPGERAQRSAAARSAFDTHLSPLPATAPLVGLYDRMASVTTAGSVRARR